MYACICRGVTEAEVRQAGRAGVVSPGALISVLGLDDDACCGQCPERVQEFVALALEGAATARPQAMRQCLATAG